MPGDALLVLICAVPLTAILAAILILDGRTTPTHLSRARQAEPARVVRACADSAACSDRLPSPKPE